MNNFYPTFVIKGLIAKLAIIYYSRSEIIQRERILLKHISIP